MWRLNRLFMSRRSLETGALSFEGMVRAVPVVVVEERVKALGALRLLGICFYCYYY